MSLLPEVRTQSGTEDTSTESQGKRKPNTVPQLLLSTTVLLASWLGDGAAQPCLFACLTQHPNT